MSETPMNPKEGEEPDRTLRHNPSPRTLEESRREYYRWHPNLEPDQSREADK